MKISSNESFWNECACTYTYVATCLCGYCPSLLQQQMDQCSSQLLSYWTTPYLRHPINAYRRMWYGRN